MTVTQIHDPAGLRSAYGGNVAKEYIPTRFASELMRLLHDRQKAAVQNALNQSKAQTVLEIAPGPGRLTNHLKPQGKLVCLEYNEGMIEEGQHQCEKRAVWVRGDAFRLPFGQCFDLVYCFRFVRHFHKEDRGRLYAGIRRVLRPGGWFVMDAVNMRISKPLRDAHPEAYPVYDELYQAEDLCQELLGAGLEVTTLEPVQRRFWWQGLSQNLIGPRANWLNRMVIRGLEKLPARDGLEWIVTCRRA